MNDSSLLTVSSDQSQKTIVTISKREVKDTVTTTNDKDFLAGSSDVSAFNIPLTTDDDVKEIQEGDSCHIVYMCDVCRKATFPTFEEASNHEASCDGSQPINQKPFLTKPDKGSNNHHKKRDSSLSNYSELDSKSKNRKALQPKTENNLPIDSSSLLQTSSMNPKYTDTHRPSSETNMSNNSDESSNQIPSSDKVSIVSNPVQGKSAPIKRTSRKGVIHDTSASKAGPAEVQTLQSTIRMSNSEQSPENGSLSNNASFIGQRVYAEYPKNRQWYWGQITKETIASPITNSDSNSAFPYSSTRQPLVTYQVWFDDGEIVDGISGRSIITESEYRNKWQDIFGRAPPDRPEHLSKSSSTSSRRSPHDLFRERCGECDLCIRPACGKCHGCSRSASYPSEERAVCVRKMCLDIPQKEKAQPAVGFPDGWTFFFTTSSAADALSSPPLSPGPSGLILLSPMQQVFRSLDDAVKQYHGSLANIPNLKRDFYKHIGESFVEETTTPKGRSRDFDDAEGRSSKKRARKSKAIQKRELSTRKEVGSRVYCRFTNGSYYWGEVVEKKVGNTGIHYDIQFDDGDFLSDVSDTGDDALEGNIYTEHGFFESVGMYPPKRPSDLPPVKRARVSSSFSPSELFDKRCKTCSSCTKKDCQRCISCINNREAQSDQKECCLQKMCCVIERDSKKQPAPGLPKGWTFATGEGPKMMLFSPIGEEFNSFEQALERCSGELKDLMSSIMEFQAHVGGTVLWNDDSHFLVGKEYYHEWTDVYGHNRVICGVITKCERDKLDEDYASFCVTYSSESLKDILRTRVFPALDIEPTSTMSLEWALGGHLAYNSHFENEASSLEERGLSIPARRWHTPSMRTEELVEGPDGKALPRLILIWNAYRLVFTVRESTVPNAGFGVFVQCTSLVPGRSEFRLRKCEMLDLGVYAPFRKEDLKEESVFLVKNFVLGLKCEEWAFDTGPSLTSSQFDITDDWTGDLHHLAAQHIPAYVNECKLEDTPTVHAEHDPEGVVHYLLGVRQKNLVLPTDGSMAEIFINYGPIYERVRIRKNYSFLGPMDRLEQTKSLAQEDAEYLEEIAAYQEPEVTCCVEFLSTIVETGKIPSEFLRRALCASVALRHKGRSFLKSMVSSTPFALEFMDHLKICDKVVSILLERIGDDKLSELENSGDHFSLLSELVNPLLQDLDSEEIGKVLEFFSPSISET